jgi:hypothetical protein
LIPRPVSSLLFIVLCLIYWLIASIFVHFISSQCRLPDGLFSYQNSRIGYTYFGGPWIGKCWYILWRFGNFVVIWYKYFHRFGTLYHETSGNPGREHVFFVSATWWTGWASFATACNCRPTRSTCRSGDNQQCLLLSPCTGGRCDFVSSC